MKIKNIVVTAEFKKMIGEIADIIIRKMDGAYDGVIQNGKINITAEMYAAMSEMVLHMGDSRVTGDIDLSDDFVTSTKEGLMELYENNPIEQLMEGWAVKNGIVRCKSSLDLIEALTAIREQANHPMDPAVGFGILCGFHLARLLVETKLQIKSVPTALTTISPKEGNEMKGSNSVFYREDKKEMFEELLAKANRSIEFDMEWANGTGYFNGARDVEVPHGEIWTAVAPAPDSRRLVLIGTCVGTIVLFERYTPDGDSPFVVVNNIPLPLRAAVENGSMNADQIFNAAHRVPQLTASLQHYFSKAS